MLYVPLDDAELEERRRLIILSGGPLAQAFGKITSWLRFNTGDGSVITGIGWSSVVDKLNSNPGVQTTDARRPVNGIAANGVPTATFASASSSSLAVPLIAGNNNKSKWGCRMWAKIPGATTGMLVSISSGTGGANAPSIQLYAENGAPRQLRADMYVSGSTGRFCRSGANFLPVAGTYCWIGMFFDKSLATEPEQCRLMCNTLAPVSPTFANLGAGASLSLGLQAATGNMIIGNINNSATPSVALDGTIGDIFFHGVDFTVEEDTALMNFAVLT